MSFEFDGFNYKGFNVSWMENLDSDIFGGWGEEKTIAELAIDSVPLVYLVVLYSIGRDLKFKRKAEINGDERQFKCLDVLSLDKKIRDVGKMFYEEFNSVEDDSDNGYVIVHNNVIKVINPVPTKGYILAEHFQDISFEKENDELKLVIPINIDGKYVWIPEGGLERYIVPIHNGKIYDNQTGLPLRTVEGKERAINERMKAGSTEEQATKELSRLSAIIEPGLHIVCSRFNKRVGPFSITFYSEKSFLNKDESCRSLSVCDVMKGYHLAYM